MFSRVENVLCGTARFGVLDLGLRFESALESNYEQRTRDILDSGI